MESHALLLWWLYDTFIFWSLKVWLNRLYMEKQKSGFIIIYIYLSFWRWTKVLWDNIRVTKWWQNLFSFLLFIYLFLHELPPLNLIHRNINLSIENLRLTVYGKAIHLSMKSSLEKKKERKTNNTIFYLEIIQAFSPFPPKSVLLFNNVSSCNILVFSYLVCLLIIGEFELLNGQKSCGLTKRNKILLLSDRVKLTWPRRQFIGTPGLVKCVTDSHRLGTQNSTPLISFRCTVRLHCLSLQT